MGMAMLHNFPEPDPEIDIGEKGKVIDYLTDFMMGFFFWPFLVFLTSVTVEMASDPLSIHEGTAILFVVMLTGIYYVLSKKQPLIFETNKKNLLAIMLGFFTYIFITVLYNS